MAPRKSCAQNEDYNEDDSVETNQRSALQIDKFQLKQEQVVSGYVRIEYHLLSSVARLRRESHGA